MGWRGYTPCVSFNFPVSLTPFSPAGESLTHFPDPFFERKSLGNCVSVLKSSFRKGLVLVLTKLGYFCGRMSDFKMAAADTEALDILESKIQELELKVYGEKGEPTENFNPVIDSLLQANTIMAAAISGREKFTSLFKRLEELNHYLEMNPLSEDPKGLSTKLNIILSLKDQYEESAEMMEKINELKNVLDDDKIKNTQLLKDDLNNLLAQHLSKKEKLNEINNEVGNVLTNFNEVCLEVSKSLFLLNEAITKLEKNKK